MHKNSAVCSTCASEAIPHPRSLMAYTKTDPTISEAAQLPITAVVNVNTICEGPYVRHPACRFEHLVMLLPGYILPHFIRAAALLVCHYRGWRKIITTQPLLAIVIRDIHKLCFDAQIQNNGSRLCLGHCHQSAAVVTACPPHSLGDCLTSLYIRRQHSRDSRRRIYFLAVYRPFP